ncbi:hypothetical protein ACFYO0_14155 [Streptomyces sp. NPDC006365]|uniref:hypothetical protein n=1 Tax=Streptomyces sp. NPDC006365 TaxID=3364744 RepID=UPI0036AEC8DB
MTPWLRTLSTAGLLLVLGAVPAPVSYASPASNSLFVAPHTESYADEPVPTESRAGSSAGVGRQRPGRQASPEEDAGAIRTEIDPGVPEVPDIPVGPETGVGSDVSSEPSRHAAPPSSSQPVLRLLPLGSGLVLIGLGLGLAFLGLRVRRG